MECSANSQAKMSGEGEGSATKEVDGEAARAQDEGAMSCMQRRSRLRATASTKPGGTPIEAYADAAARIQASRPDTGVSPKEMPNGGRPQGCEP